MLFIAMLLYIVTAILGFYAGWLFYKSVDGKLRKTLIYLFAGLGTSMLLRAIWGLSEINTQIKYNPITSIAIIGLMFIVLLQFVLTIRNKI